MTGPKFKKKDRVVFGHMGTGVVLKCHVDNNEFAVPVWSYLVLFEEGGGLDLRNVFEDWLISEREDVLNHLIR